MMTPRDLERLSLYLDGQLSPAEAARLETRLERETDLRAALTDLRLARRLLRTLPPVKPPRNFTLTAAQAASLRRPRSSWFPVLRLATMLTALVLALAVGADLGGAGVFLSSAPAAAPMLGQAAPAATLEMTPAAKAVLEAETAAPAANLPTPEATPGAETALRVLPTASPELPLGAGAALAPTATPEAALSALASAPADGQRATPAAPDVTAIAALDAAPAGLTLAVPTDAGPGDSDDVSIFGTIPGPDLDRSPRPASPLLRQIEIGLALLTVGLGGAAWLLRRR